MTGNGVEGSAQSARSRALAVLRVRGRALAVALLPAAVAVILLVGGSTGHLVGHGWDLARWVVGAVAVVVLLAAAGIGAVVARARPAMSPTVPVPEESAPDLYRLVRDLADRLDVPAPSAIALTPDCDSWLEDRTHPAHGPPAGADRDEPDGPVGLPPGRSRRAAAAPVLVIGSPFLWWMRVGELRAVLAPVVAGTGPSAHPDIAAARRFVRGLDAAVAAASTAGRCPLSHAVCAAVGWVARLMLRGCREDAAQMERGVAAAAADRAQAVDYGLRIVAQEQVGLAYAGWDRLLTRVALPAWRMGRWPSRLDAGVVAALTELSRRDRLAEGFASRLGERPACDLLEEPGTVDEATSLLAARLFHGGPAGTGPDWAPVDWADYPEEVVDRKWRTDAARLHRVLDALGVRRAPGSPAGDPHGATLERVLRHLSADHLLASPPHGPGEPSGTAEPTRTAEALRSTEPTGPAGPARSPGPAGPAGPAGSPGLSGSAGPAASDEKAQAAPVAGRPAGADEPHELYEPHEPGGPYGSYGLDGSYGPDKSYGTDESYGPDDDESDPGTEHGAALAAGLSAELAREEAAAPATPAAESSGQTPAEPPWDEGALPLLPLQPPRTGRELLADHVTAMVCCAAMDTAGAAPGLDWLDGPSLLIDGERAADLGPKVLALVEDGDPGPLRTWLIDAGIRPEKPVRLA
ncbi:hypothetical protein ACH4C2_10770 [Streptomyces sp. NPDC018057]|uniref:hypothetical protein n=1 Tax=unclassified Streptomyces TaxID=2593676 RepID=UPI00379A6ED0